MSFTDYKISDTEICDVIINFPSIYFTIKDLNYDNDIYPDNATVANMVSLNFSNITNYLNEVYSKQQTDLKNI